MRKNIVFAALALAGLATLGFTPTRHDNSYTTNGVTYAQRGGLGSADYVVTNIDADAVGKVKSVNGKDGVVTLDYSDVSALPDSQALLGGNANFSNAVVSVSPPVELPEKWALADVTNATGGAVSAVDVGAATAEQGAKADAALSRAEAEAGFTEWTVECDTPGVVLVYVESEDEALSPSGWQPRLNGSNFGTVKGYADSVSLSWTYGDDASADITATRTRLPTMADIPTKTSDLTNDGAPNGGGTPYASTADVHLTTVYGGNGKRFSEWVGSKPGLSVGWSEEDGVWVFSNGMPCKEPEKYDINATRLESIPDPQITATRTENPIIGYTLGSQTTKPLQPKGDYAPATNIQKAALASDVQTSLGKADTAVQPFGQSFDFATMQGVFVGVKACIEALGGSVTNFPANN